MSTTQIHRGDGEMEFRILGPIEVRDGERTLTPATARQRALLGVLLLHAQEAVPAAVLVDAIWGDTPPQRPQTALRTELQGLRRALQRGRAADSESILVSDDAGHRLAVDPESVDLCRFEQLTAEARQAVDDDPVRASALLREAASLWRGPALTGVSLAGHARDEVARLNGLRLTALADRVQADLGLGRHAAVVPELEALVVANPRNERLLALLMLALHRCGRRDDALAECANARRRFEPGPELLSLEQAVRDRDPALGAPPSRSDATVVGTPVAAADEPSDAEPALDAAPTVVDGAPTVLDGTPTVLDPTPTVHDAAAAAPGVRRRRSPVGLTGTAALVIAGGAFAGLGVQHLRAGGDARAAAVATFPNTQEQVIVRQLQPAVTGCHRYADHYAKALADVECRLTSDHAGASTVLVQSFSNYQDMEVHFHHVLGLTVQSETGRAVSTARQGRCDEAGAEFFALSNHRPHGAAASTAPNGHLLCYIDHTGIPRAAWTDNHRLTVSQATGIAGPQDTTEPALLGVWQSLSGEEEITPDATPAQPISTEAPVPAVTTAVEPAPATVPDAAPAAVTPDPPAPVSRTATPPAAAPTQAATTSAAAAHPASAGAPAAPGRGDHEGHGNGSDGWDRLHDFFDHGHDGHQHH